MVAPSSPFDAGSFEAGLEVLRSRFGLRPRMRDDIRTRTGYLAGDDARRLREWIEAASDPEAKAIWCARGGYGALRLLPRLETARLLHPPRLVVGFSDATALHVALNQAGLVTVHGPVVTQLSKLPPEALDHLEALLFGQVVPGGPPRAGGVPALGNGVLGTGVIRPGEATGPLLGGSLTLLAHLCGTPWRPRLGGAVLFIEDVGEKPYRLDRYLTQLRLSGALDGVAAVCVGQLTDCSNGETGFDDPGASGAEVVRRLVRELDVPAIDGVSAGHESMNLALPLGAVVTLVAPSGLAEGPPRLLFDQGATT